MGQYGSKNFKRHLLGKNTPDLLPNFENACVLAGVSIYQIC